jgi:hypothetical protein
MEIRSPFIKISPIGLELGLVSINPPNLKANEEFASPTAAKAPATVAPELQCILEVPDSLYRRATRPPPSPCKRSPEAAVSPCFIRVNPCPSVAQFSFS